MYQKPDDYKNKMTAEYRASFDIQSITPPEIKPKYKWQLFSPNVWNVINISSGKSIKVNTDTYKTKETIFNFLDFTIG